MQHNKFTLFIFENLEIEKYKSLLVVLHRGRFDFESGRFDMGIFWRGDILTKGYFDPRTFWPVDPEVDCSTFVIKNLTNEAFQSNKFTWSYDVDIILKFCLCHVLQLRKMKFQVVATLVAENCWF